MKYGVSFNCNIYMPNGRTEVGGGGEGDISVDYISDDLNKLIEAMIGEQDYGAVYISKEGHQYIDHDTDVGGKVVAVIGEQETEDDFYVACVVFEGADGPTVI